MDIIIYILILSVGGFIGYRRFLKPSILNRLDTLQSGALLLLLFIMGVNIGLDDTVIAKATDGNIAIIAFISGVALTAVVPVLVPFMMTLG